MCQETRKRPRTGPRGMPMFRGQKEEEKEAEGMDTREGENSGEGGVQKPRGESVLRRGKESSIAFNATSTQGQKCNHWIQQQGSLGLPTRAIVGQLGIGGVGQRESRLHEQR